MSQEDYIMIEIEFEFNREELYAHKARIWPKTLDELVPFGLEYDIDDLLNIVKIKCPIKVITNMHPNSFAFSIEFLEGQELIAVLSDCSVNIIPAADEV